LVFHKYKRKKSLSEIGIKKPQGESINIILSIIGCLLILYVQFGSQLKDLFTTDFSFIVFLELFLLKFLSSIEQEVLYRGIMQTDAMDKFGRWRGIFIVSVIFTIVHFNLSGHLMTQMRYLFSIFIGGFFWGYLYSKKRNLISPIIGHILANVLIGMLEIY